MIIFDIKKMILSYSLCYTTAMLLASSPQGRYYEDAIAQANAELFQKTNLAKLVQLPNNTTSDNINTRIPSEDRYPLEYAFFILRRLKQTPDCAERIIQDLLKKKADANLFVKSRPLKEAILLNRSTLVQKLIKHDAQVPKNILVDDEITLENLEIVKLLVENGADIHAKNSLNQKALDRTQNTAVFDYLAECERNGGKLPCWKCCWPIKG